MYRSRRHGWYHCRTLHSLLHHTLGRRTEGFFVQIYGLVVSVLISGDLKSPMALYTGFIQLGAGLSVGLAGLSAGFAIGIVGDAGVRGVAQQVCLSIFSSHENIDTDSRFCSVPRFRRNGTLIRSKSLEVVSLILLIRSLVIHRFLFSFSRTFEVLVSSLQANR